MYKNNSKRHYKVGLRVNFDINIDGIESTSKMDLNKVDLVFVLENGNFEKALNELKRMENVDVVGLHGHFSTQNKELKSI